MISYFQNGKPRTIRTDKEFKRFWGNGEIREHVKHGEFVKRYSQNGKLKELHNIKEGSVTRFGVIEGEDDMASGPQTFQD